MTESSHDPSSPAETTLKPGDDEVARKPSAVEAIPENTDTLVEEDSAANALNFKDSNLNFYLNKLESDSDDASDFSEINLPEMSDSNEEETKQKKAPSPVTQYNEETHSTLRRLLPAEELNISVKSLLRNFGEFNLKSEIQRSVPHEENKTSEHTGPTTNERAKTSLHPDPIIDSKEGSHKKSPFDVKNFLLILAQETVRKQKEEIDRLRREREDQSKLEITRLIDLLAITFNNFKLLNDKNVSISKVKNTSN